MGAAGGGPRGADPGGKGMPGGEWMAGGGCGMGGLGMGGMVGLGQMPGMGGAWPPNPAAQCAPVPQIRLCPACNNECAPTHRFCAFCGADQSQVQQSPSMRADAPTFTPSFGAGYGPAGVPGLGSDGGAGGLGGPVQVPLPQQQGAQDVGVPWQPLSGGLRSPEIITDELDVMRGRMVLLAALRDMEERESMGVDVSRAPGGSMPGARKLQQPPGGGRGGGGLGTREDFLSVIG